MLGAATDGVSTLLFVIGIWLLPDGGALDPVGDRTGALKFRLLPGPVGGLKVDGVLAGDLLPRAGDRVSRTGDLVPRAGDPLPRAGDLVPLTGDLVPRTGDLAGAWRGAGLGWSLSLYANEFCGERGLGSGLASGRGVDTSARRLGWICGDAGREVVADVLPDATRSRGELDGDRPRTC